MKRHQGISLVLLILTATACVGQTQTERPWQARPVAALETRIDPNLQQTLIANLNQLVGERNIPGMAVAVVRAEGIVASGQTGRRMLGSDVPIAAGDRFHIGSEAKAMTATMIATLVEEGRLSWTSTPGDIFPEFGAAMNSRLRNATLEQFLSHRAGLPPFTDREEYRTLGVPVFTGSVPEQRQGFVRWLLVRQPPYEAGTFRYSNADYAVAAAMAERVTGRTWEDLMRERVFEPLGLQSAGFGWPRTLGPGQPSGHWFRGGNYVPHGPDDPYELSAPTGPGGNIHMSIDDLARFAGAHLAGLRGRDGLVEAETVRRMHQPMSGGDYALGWASNPRTFGEPRSWHNGGTGIFFATMWIFPDRDLALVAAANGDSEDVKRTASVVLQRIRRAVIAADGATAPAPAPRPGS